MDFEEKFSPKKRQNRQERKLKSLKDRSKYKKTDQKKVEFEAPSSPKGRVISVRSEGVLVEHEDKGMLCELKGSLKKGRSKQKKSCLCGRLCFFRSGKKNHREGRAKNNSSIQSRSLAPKKGAIDRCKY